MARDWLRRLLALGATLVLALAVVPDAGEAALPPEMARVTSTGEPTLTSWDQVRGLAGEGKAEQALQIAEGLLARARAQEDDAELARSLIHLAQLRTGLNGYEAAVRLLAEQEWPRDSLYRSAVALYYAHSLVTYTRTYSWEISRREQTEAKGPGDLRSWTKEELLGQARQTYLQLWDLRETLGALPVETLGEYLEPNSYPRDVRGTLRDAVAYLFVELLLDTAFWTPEQANDLFRVGLAGLLAGAAPQSTAPAIRDPTAHPLVQISAILDDLEAWHAGRGERAAVLETRLERLRRLRAVFRDRADQTAIGAALQQQLPQFRDLPWWAVGQDLLALWVGEDDFPGSQVRARSLALEGWQTYPDSLGGRRCEHRVKSIEAPEFKLESMAQDGAGKRSIKISHRNLERLYFRAFAVDLERRIATDTDYYAVLFNASAMQKVLATEKPAAEWTVELPATPDFLEHATYVTPPMKGPGQFMVAASARSDFALVDNKIQAVNLVLSDLVLVTRQESGNTLEVQVLSGASGRGIAGAGVGLYRYDYHKGHRQVASATSDGDGFVRLTGPEGENLFLFAKKGDELALDEKSIWFHGTGSPSDGDQSLVYTDRSLYRPGQKLFWKLVSYRSSDQGKRFQVQPGATLTLDLLDPNDEKVASVQATSNAFGSAAGELTIPSGRLLGAWRLSATPSGSARIRVEEYKRPTFEVGFPDPASPLRLNRPAEIRGEAKYYFGLPLVYGIVKWRVVRDPVYPRHWHGFDWPHGDRQTVAIGTGTLDEKGQFLVNFTPEVDERDPPQRDISYQYQVTADVTDEGGETQSATRSVRLGLVSVEAEVDTEVGFFLEQTENSLTVIRADLDGAPKPGQGSWTLFALKQPEVMRLPADQPLPTPPQGADGYQTEGDRLRPRWDTSVDPDELLRNWDDGAELGRGTIVHDTKGQAKVALPALPPGGYRLRYETVDDFGEVCRTQQEFLVAGKRTALALPALLRVEKPNVAAGGTARFLVISGLVSQPIWFELFRDGKLLQRQKLESASDSQLIEVPVTDADRGGFGIRLTLVRDHQFLSVTDSLFVPWDDKELKLELASFRDKIRPGTQETWRVTVRRPDGIAADGSERWTPEAGSAELLAYLYDRSLDLFAPHLPPAVASLYPIRSQVSGARSTLRQAPSAYAVGMNWHPLPQYPGLVGDRLNEQDGGGLAGAAVRLRNRYQSTVPGVPPRPPRVAASPEVLRASPAEYFFFDAERLLAQGPATQAAMPTESLPAPSEPAPKVEIRSNFAETAFWQPQLLTGPDGSVSIEFQVPDSVTSWNFWLHALTKDLRGGSLHRETQSIKDLMVRPYVPRFLREGDRAELKVVVNNASARDMEGRLRFEILDPDTRHSRMRDFGFPSDQPVSLPVAVKAGGGQNLSFPILVPNRPGPVAFQVTAQAGDQSDGELRMLPVLPGRMHLAQSRFAALKAGVPQVLEFEDLARNHDPTRVNDFLAVTLDAQLFSQVLEALPYLVRYPYECSEQTLNRFLSTGIVASLYARYPVIARMSAEFSKREARLATFDAADPNHKMTLEETPWLREARGQDGTSEDLINVLDPRIAKAERERSLVKLSKTQTALGAFPWWPGGPPSTYMTLYLVHGFSKGLEFGVEVPKDLVVKAFGYLHQHYLDDWSRQLQDRDTGWELITLLNYILSNFPDPSWTGGLFSAAERTRMLEFSFKHWKQHSPYLKGLLALTLKRANRPGEAQLVWDAVMDSAKTTQDEGTYWAPEDRPWLWYNDRIETHAFALRTLMELNPTDPRAEGLVQWLLLNKKANQWKSTRATAEVIYALVWYLRQTGGLGVRETAEVRIGHRETRFEFDPDRYNGKKNQVLIPGEQMNPATDASIRIEKGGPGLAFASATWHFSTEQLPDAERGDFFQVSRSYFLRESTQAGFVLKPLAEGSPVKVGDQIEVHLSLRAKQAAEYVHLRDPRAAGLEPENPVSRYRWDLGIGWYEEVRDSGANFFFEALPAGEYPFQYRLRANMAGTFKVGPATVQSMYAPEISAYSAGSTLEINGE